MDIIFFVVSLSLEAETDGVEEITTFAFVIVKPKFRERIKKNYKMYCIFIYDVKQDIFANLVHSRLCARLQSLGVLQILKLGTFLNMCFNPTPVFIKPFSFWPTRLLNIQPI